MKLLAIDGNSILNRAFYGIKLLTTKDGIYTNAIYGFLNILQRLEKSINPDAVAIAFDVSKTTFRHEKYDFYKQNRKGMPEELASQLPLIKEVLTYMGYCILGKQGFEGDDILGSLARCAEENNETCVIATGDRDCLQLVSDNVSVLLVKTKEDVLYDKTRFFEEYGFDPLGIIDLKALMGDTSDNIPGVKGIGEKTALTLVQKYKSINEIYKDIDAIDATDRVKKLLKEGKEQAFASYELATIIKDVEVDCDMNSYVRKPMNEKELAELLSKLELYSVIKRLELPLIANDDKENEEDDAQKLNVTVKNSIDEMNFNDTKAIYLLNYNDSLLVNVKGTVYDIESSKRDDVLKEIFKRNISIYTFMAKSICKYAKKLGFDTINLKFDAELAAYLLNTNSKGYDLDVLSNSYLRGKSFDTDEKYQQIALFPILCDVMDKQLAEKEMKKLFEEIEVPLLQVLSDMEDEGFMIDKDGVIAFGEKLSSDIELLKGQIYRLAGEEFNINSTKELSHILFEKLSIPTGKKTKTGYSTNAEVLESLVEKHPIILNILEYRQLTKLYSTYVTGLLKEIKEDNRIHSTFNQTETRTGRISSLNPNVQNIPVRTKLGSEMRKFFVAREGYALIDADYSQIELRILAHIANDKNMIEAFNQNADIHAITASQVFGYKLEELPSELRSKAKAINFGIVYGIGAYSLSKDIHTSVYEAKEYINAYLKTYSGVERYMKEVVENAERDGYVRTLYNRRRELADIHSKNKTVKAFAQRVALNAPVQGTAADIIKLAMVRVHKRLKDEFPDAKLILQVHDELIIEAPVIQSDMIKSILKTEMENAANLNVPLVVDVHTGKNWYTAKG